MKLSREKANMLLSIVLQYRMKPMTCKEYNLLRHYVRVVCGLGVDLERYIEVRYGHFKDGTPGAMIVNFWDKVHGAPEYDFKYKYVWTYYGEPLKQRA